MKNKKSVWMSAFKNVVPAEYERWLEQMESQGWHVQKIGQWSSIRMVFTKNRPQKYRYVYDMQPFLKKEYIATYEAFGWEFVGQMASACIWRRPYDKERPEAFTDAESIEKRGTRFAGAASVSMILFWITTIIIVTVILLNGSNMLWSDVLQLWILSALTLAFAGYMTWVVRKIYKNRNQK